MKTLRSLLTACLLFVSSVTLAGAQVTYSWRYYRPGNTGIQGDWNETIWIGADGNPWIGGYSPVAEEGGVAEFVQAENRWINVSNIDYPVIGSANDIGFCRVTDMVADGLGNLWLGTWRGALRMNLAAGPSSLVRFGPENSALPGGGTEDITRAPDGSIWISAGSSVWGGGGLTRYDPATNQWSHIDDHGGLKIAAQPKPGGGYYLWASGEGFSPMERWSSTTQTWTSYPATSGNPSHLVSLDSADEAGNVWMQRWIGGQGEETLDCLRPDGTWVTPPLPPMHPQVGVAALRAFGTMQALVVNGYGHLYRFDGTSWTDLGPVPHNGFIDDLDIDAAGNIWLCGTGTGGALRRDADTGFWQRYRITNTSQFDLFNNDLAVDQQTGDVYACANAASGFGGMVKFDGTRWTGFNDFTYGLGGPWPFPSDNSEAVYVRPSNGKVVVNPMNQFTHEYDGTSWTAIPGGPDQVQNYVEDSLGRLWSAGHYGGVGVYENGGYTSMGGGSWFNRVYRDPVRAGTVWTSSDGEVRRTDGSYSFSCLIDAFPQLTAYGATFGNTLAIAADGSAWAGTWGASTTAASALIRVNPNSGTSEIIYTHDGGWPFPGDVVRPMTVTPDGRVWMTYESEYPSTVSGLLWWDGTNVGHFPAPPGGEWQWGGLPHAAILDLEVKSIPNGYELWMSCVTRGLAVLSVGLTNPVSVDPGTNSPTLSLEQNRPNPFRASTSLAFTMPHEGHARLTVCDATGRLVRTLVDEVTTAGRHEVIWDGKDNGGRIIPRGVYYYSLDGPATQLGRGKMIFMR